MQRNPRDIEVEITFLSAENGGRSRPMLTGYQPQFHYDGYDWSAVHTYIGRDRVAPGETVRAYLSFLSPEQHAGHIRPGMPFLIREGARVMGYGVVLNVPELDASAERARQTGRHPLTLPLPNGPERPSVRNPTG